jgi:5-methylcytosine-specific restriction endonuclease McrA
MAMGADARSGAVGHADRCLEAISGAVQAVIAGDRAAAGAHLEPIRGELWSGMPAWDRPTVGHPRQLVQTPGHSSTPVRAAETFVRDRFQCRYCGQRLIPVCLMSVLSRLFPAELPYVSTYKQGAIHPAYWEIGAEADHIVPGSRGGSWSDPANHATACVVCNTRKSHWTLDELGWELRTARDASWDGLIPLYRRFWETSGKPTSGSQRAWLQAFEVAMST